MTWSSGARRRTWTLYRGPWRRSNGSEKVSSASSSISPAEICGETSWKRITGSPRFRINWTGPCFPGRKESRNTSCRSTTRCKEASESFGDIGPRILTRQQMWFDTSDGGAGEVSHNSRWENVSGWSWASPLASHCLKRARFSSDMRSCLEQRIFFVADQAIDLFARKRVEIDFARNRFDLGLWRRNWRSGNR